MPHDDPSDPAQGVRALQKTVERMLTGTAADSRHPGTGVDSLQLGNGAEAMADQSIAIGPLMGTYGLYSLACGYNGSADGLRSIALGDTPWAAEDFAIAIGWNAQALAKWAIAIGSVIHVTERERCAVGARDLEVRRSSVAAADDDGSYGTGPETGLILSDSDGVKWRITVDTAGALQVAAV